VFRPRKVIPFRYWDISISPLRRQLYTTLSAEAFDTSSIAVASEEKSLAWRPIYDRSPTSFGISDFWGFLPMIPQGTRLPAKKKITMSNTVPNADFDDFKIQFRHSARDVPVDIIVARLENLWPAESGKTKMKITMEMDKSLLGTFTAEDLVTKSHISVEFDGGAACHKQGSVDIVTSSPK
jgi:hypothetical protein